MELVILEETKTKLVFELVGAGHTFCNALREALWNDEKVNAASYAIEHPLVGTPKFTLETSAKAPRDALKDAVSMLKKQNTEMQKQLTKLL